MTKFIHLTDNLQNPKRVEGNKSVEDVLNADFLARQYVKDKTK